MKPPPVLKVTLNKDRAGYGWRSRVPEAGLCWTSETMATRPRSKAPPRQQRCSLEAVIPEAPQPRGSSHLFLPEGHQGRRRRTLLKQPGGQQVPEEGPGLHVLTHGHFVTGRAYRQGEAEATQTPDILGQPQRYLVQGHRVQGAQHQDPQLRQDSLPGRTGGTPAGTGEVAHQGPGQPGGSIGTIAQGQRLVDGGAQDHACALGVRTRGSVVEMYGEIEHARKYTKRIGDTSKGHLIPGSAGMRSRA